MVYDVSALTAISGWVRTYEIFWFLYFLFVFAPQQHGYLLVQEKVDLQQWAKEMI
jgi:hypothetical protein